MENKSRVILFDELRGVSILSMLLYHLCYDLAVLFGVGGMQWFFSPAASLWQLCICGVFIFVAGACCSYSKNNLRRGLRLFLLGMLFTVVTAVVMPDQLIVFGLLHFLGVAVLVSIPCRRAFAHMKPLIGVAAGLVLFWLTYHVQSGWIGVSPTLSVQLPRLLYRTNWLCFLGFYNHNFASADFFPLLPYLFLFWAGLFSSRLKLPSCFYRSHCRPLSFLGRNSLWIYLFHQPVLYLVLWLIFA